ncbi:hypothetical protein [Caenispirillum bisanense]|uniref:hypothetical protein n=1 Tax=Caenispirillum bisanense TaxID=414052 RepID=UPI0031E2D926
MLQILTVGTPSPAQRPVVLALEGREDARLSSVDTVAAVAGTAADVVVLWGTAAEQAEAAARLGAGAGAPPPPPPPTARRCGWWRRWRRTTVMPPWRCWRPGSPTCCAPA